MLLLSMVFVVSTVYVVFKVPKLQRRVGILIDPSF